jgi:hypothetical protein
MTERTMLGHAVRCSLVAVAALLSPVFDAAGQSVSAPAAGTPVAQHHETLASLGLADGLGLVDPTQSRDIYYHGTDGVVAWDGRLHLDLALAVHDFRYSFVQVLVNDVPKWSQSIATPNVEIPVDLPLSAAELSHAFVKVTLRFGGRLNDDRCYDWRTNGSYITVKPSSGVQYNYRPEQVTTIDGAWSVLPRAVTVAIPAGALPPALYRAAWQAGAALLRAGHAVTYAPITGDIAGAGAFISPPSDSSEGTGVVIVAARSLVADTGDSSARSANLALARVSGKPVIVVGDSFPAAQFLGEDWRHIAQSDRMRVDVSRAERDVGAASPTITFQQLGLGSVTRDLGERAEWSFPFSVRDLSPGFIPANIDLDLVAGLSPDRKGTVAQLFLNDVLIRSAPINESGTAQRISAELPRRLIGVDNTLRLVLQRKAANSLSPSTGECRALSATSPAQVLETSVITGKRIDDLTEFLELPALFRGGFDVYLPAPVLTDPTATLSFLARLGADVLPMTDLDSLVFYDSGHPPSPKRLFLMLGTVDVVHVDAPARYERGRLVVDDREKKPVLALTGSARSSVVEIGSVGGVRGLIVLPLSSGALATPPSIALSRGDVAFASATGVDLVVDSRGGTRGVPRIGAPFGKYRYWAYSLMALAAAIIIIYTLRRVRSQRS